MKKFSILFVIVLVFSMLLSACGTPATPAPAVEEPAAPAEPAVEEPAAPAAPAVEEPAAPVKKVKIRWFVGLGAGSDEGTFAPQQAVVDEFNASQDKIELVLEIIDNDVAYDTLATQIAAGNAPDIVGPVGIRGRDSFKGAWLDLQPLIDKNNYDLSDFDPALVDFYDVKEEGQLGIPFGIFPSFMIYNFDLFDEAGLNYPPANYGEKYVWPDGRKAEWNMDTLREVAMALTVDSNGNDATSPDFDPESIVQFGFMNQWTDPRGIGTFFGAGSLLADDGTTAQVPDAWQEAWKWTYDGWWTSWFIPNGPYGGASFLQGPGGPFSSGNLAMVHLHMWYVAPWSLGEVPWDWNLGATPSYKGTITSKMHADTFGILKGSKNYDAAFEVLTFLLSEEVAPKLLTVYGGMPARLSLQGTYFDTYTEANFPGKDINWDVVVGGMLYADNPNHESWMPSFQETTDRYNEFWNYLANTPDLDVDAEIAVLRDALQAIFDSVR
ncbi:MAG: sugar ABC transporter substrate-binding protein [Chloroflexi bacterium HGW-Chloroflexi-3]|nr:MAG: sugar ABC transporter substrate-binding protein [Chloroflexi bacterium HGW-Chloroflexi-3]